MATNGKRSVGVGIVGAVFAITGLVFLIAGKSAIGIAIAAAGVVFIAAGAAAARKAALPDDGRATRPPATGGSGRA